MSADEIYEKVRSRGILEQGIEQGMEPGVERGEFDMALKFSCIFSVEKASRISGFSLEELERGELINR